MEYDKDKVDDLVLALMYLGMFSERSVQRAWKSFDWDALDRLHEKGYISNPKSAAKSIRNQSKPQTQLTCRIDRS
jgi:hypothetical protein